MRESYEAYVKRNDEKRKKNYTAMGVGVFGAVVGALAVVAGPVVAGALAGAAVV